MNKDALLATLIGFGIGLFITGILLVGPNIVKYLPHIQFPNISFPKTQPKEAKVTPTPTPTPGLTIDSPLPDAIESESELLISGTTVPDSIVVLQGPTDDTVVLAKTDGKYSGKVTLIEGKNDIIVTSTGKGKSLSQTVTVFYTSEEL